MRRFNVVAMVSPDGNGKWVEAREADAVVDGLKWNIRLWAQALHEASKKPAEVKRIAEAMMREVES